MTLILLLFGVCGELFEMHMMLYGRAWSAVETFDRRFFAVGCCCCCCWHLQYSWTNQKRHEAACMFGIAAVLLFARSGAPWLLWVVAGGSGGWGESGRRNVL